MGTVALLAVWGLRSIFRTIFFLPFLNRPVPQRRAANRERADVVIEESFSRPSFPPPSTTRSSELM
jgi:hypothetical protein